MPLFFDNHSHISPFHAYSEGIQRVVSIDIAKPEEVSYMQNNADSALLFTAGLHPWSLNSVNDEHILETLLHESLPIIGIGECGLDAVIQTPLDIQISWFTRQAIIAERIKKPLIIHCVRAFNELQKLKRTLQPSMPWIIHGYSKNQEFSKELLHQGFILSFGCGIMSNHSAQSALMECPEGAFFLETDESQYSIQDIYLKAAELRNISLDALHNIIDKNKHTFYGTN